MIHSALMKAAPQAQILPSMLNISVTNAVIGLGSVIGGMTIEHAIAMVCDHFF